jgi:hypothetical protein
MGPMALNLPQMTSGTKSNTVPVNPNATATPAIANPLVGNPMATTQNNPFAAPTAIPAASGTVPTTAATTGTALPAGTHTGLELELLYRMC